MNNLILVTAKRLWFFFWFLLALQVILLVYVAHIIGVKYPEAKYLRETHLYVYMVFIVIYISLTSWLYATSRRVDRELKRIAKLAGTNAYNAQRVGRLLGQFGLYLNEILEQTLLLSEKRRYKISAQRILVDVLTEMLDHFFIVVDVSGNVVSYSAPAKERLGPELQEKKYLGDLIPEFEVKRYVAYFSTQSDIINAGSYQCYPIYDDASILNYVCILDEEYFLKKRIERNLGHQVHKTLHGHYTY